MTTSIFKFSHSKRLGKYHYQIVAAIFLTVPLLTACQKDPEPKPEEAATEVAIPTTPVTSNINAPIETNEKSDTAKLAASPKQDISLPKLEGDLESPEAQNDPMMIPEQALQGAQITNVKYRSASGDSLTVVFETSAAGMLNAIVTLPNKPKMTLSAPEGQGNNPTYRSNDGSIELVSHAGGSTIDLIQDNKITSFTAISADAEVVIE